LSKDIARENQPVVTQLQIALDNPYQKGITLPDTKFVDRMAAVLDVLDAEYEEELKNKPKKLTKKSSKKSREPKATTQKRSNVEKKNSSD
jgi:diketogulonate reductase-like aldo/keto reductase